MNMMKKICLLVLIMVLGKLSFSQGYPVTQYIGTDSAVVISRGAMQSRLVNYVYTDTTQANTQRIKAYPGAQIVTTNGGTNFILWIRNQNATRWLQIPAGSGVGNIYTVDGTLTGNRTLLGANNSLTFNQISSLLFGADTTTVTNDGVATLNVKGAIGRVLVVDTTAPADERIYELKSSNGEFFISKINDAQTLQDSTFYISSGGNIGINTFSPGARLGVNGNTFVKGQLFAGDTALSTYQVEGILTTPYVLGRKAVDTTLSTQARPTGVQGHVVGRGPIANRLQGGTFYATTDSSSTANSTGSLRATTSWTAHNGSGTLANAWGSYNIVSNKTTGTITNAYGSVSGVENRGATSTINKLQGSTTEVWNNYGGTIDTAWGQVISIYNNNASSNIGAVYGLSIGRGLITPTGGTHFWRNAGTIGSSYGIYLDSAIDVGTNRFALYSNSYSDSYLKGNLGLGTTTPGGRLAIVDTGGFALKINYNSASTVADSNAAIYAENNGTSSYVAILNEKTTNNTGGQYPLLVQSSLLSGTAQAGMATGIHFATPDAQGNKKVTQLALRTTTADSATYSNRAELRLWNNGTLSTPYYLLGNGNMGLGTSTPDSNLTVVNGALFQRGVRMSGLPQTPGTKALRIDASGTISYADTLVDAGGTVTSVATNNGTGITGGTITTTGTLAIDTLLISTRAWRQKGIDSVAALANTKINGSLISGYLTKATGTNTIDTSQIYQSSGLIGIGTTSPTLKLDVNGDILINGLWAGRGSGNINTNAVLGRLAFNANTTGFQNVAVGNLTLYSNTTGSNNVAIGNSALSANTTANHNVAIGHNSMLNNTTGFQNVAVGIQSLNANTTGENNTAIGTGALGSITTGYYNAAIGLASGRYITSGANNTTSNESVYLGYDTRASANGNTNEIVIGGSAQGNGSNSVTLGNASITKTVLRENVGIGTVTPDSALTVVNGAYFQRGVRMSGLPTGVGTKAVRINANGTLSVADTLANGISGTGTTNYIPKFTSSSAIGNSIMSQGSDYIVVEAANANLRIKSTTREYFWQTVESGGRFRLYDQTAGSERLTIDASGNLGLGTSSPAAKLHVAAAAVSGTVDRAVIIANSSASGNGSGSEIYLGWNSPSINAGAGVTIGASYAGAGTNMLFSTPSSISSAPNVKMTLDGSGNLGLGVSPSAWNTVTAFQVGSTSLGGYSNTGYLNANAFYQTGWKYVNSSFSARYEINASDAGEHRWYTAPSGTAGNAISFTQAMTLDASGRLGIGTTNPIYRLVSEISSPGYSIVGQHSSGGQVAIYNSTGDNGIGTVNNYNLNLFTNNSAPQVTLTTAGRVGIGTTSPAFKLDVRQSSGGDIGAFYYTGGTKNPFIALQANTDNLMVISTGNSDNTAALRFDVSGSEQMRITSDGNVGIGTTSPDSALTVQTGAWVKRGLRLSGLPTGIGTKELRIDANGVVYANDTLSNDISGSGTTNYIPKFTSSSAIGNSLIYDDGTNIGLGTITPTSFSGYRTFAINATTGGILELQNSGTSTGLIFVDAALMTLRATTGADIRFQTNGANERMRLTSGGNLGLGTSSPDASYMATISSNTDYKGLLITGSGHQLLQVQSTTSARQAILALKNGGQQYSLTLNTDNTLQIYDNTSAATRLTLSTSGNLGLGVTPSAWSASYKAMQIGTGALWSVTSANDFFVSSNTLYDGSYKYLTNGYATNYSQYNGTHSWNIAPSGTAGNAISFTQAMTLDASGNLGVGTTSPQSFRLAVMGANQTQGDANTTMRIFDNTSATTNTGGGISFGGYFNGTSSSANTFAFIQGAKENSTADDFASVLRFGTRVNGGNPTERMRISSAGNVGIGTTSPTQKLDVVGRAVFSESAQAGNNFVAKGTLQGYSGAGAFLSYESYGGRLEAYDYSTTSWKNIAIAPNGANVGVGTEAPVTKLDVRGNINLLAGSQMIWNQAYDYYIQSDGSSYMRFATGGSERMRITSGGNVGIGTSSPSAWNGAAGVIVSQYSGSGNSIYSAQSNSTTIDQGGIFEGFSNAVTSGSKALGSIAFLRENTSTTALSSYTGFYTNNAGTVGERMRITSGGELLINTTSDAGDYKLQVNGNAILNMSSGTPLFYFNTTTANAANGIITQESGTSKWAIGANFGTGDGTFNVYNYGAAQRFLLISTGGNLEIPQGSIKTAAPSGGTAKPWRLGNVATVTPTSPNRTIEVEIDGVTYYIHAKTTND